jgi:hypothetical protein
MALEGLIRNFDELAVVEGLGFEGLDLGIDQGHVCFLTLGWVAWVNNYRMGGTH